MTSSRPYLLRAIYQWIVDNEMTPYLLVDATADKVQVPVEHISNGKIILNVSPSAVVGLDMGNESVVFNARFSGKAMQVLAPVLAVLAIYSKENGRGMVFTDEDETPPPTTPGDDPKPKQPKLRVVK